MAICSFKSADIQTGKVSEKVRGSTVYACFFQAYKNFGSRVAIVKKKLDELKLTLPDPPSPMPSPTPDAPSPGSTPPADIEMQADNTEAVDMELSESDNDTDATRNILGKYLKT